MTKSVPEMLKLALSVSPVPATLVNVWIPASVCVRGTEARRPWRWRRCFWRWWRCEGDVRRCIITSAIVTVSAFERAAVAVIRLQTQAGAALDFKSATGDQLQRGAARCQRTAVVSSPAASDQAER